MRILHVRARAGFGILSVGVLLLLASLYSKVSYDRFRKQFSQHESTITQMDFLDSTIPKLKSAEKALTTYSWRSYVSPGRRIGRRRTHHHGADPRESAQHVKRALAALEGQLGDRELAEARGKLAALFEELREVETVRTESYYSPLRERIENVRGGLESQLSRLAKKLPPKLLATRQRLRKETRITLYVGLGVSALGLLMVWGWHSDLKERRALKKSLEWDV